MSEGDRNRSRLPLASYLMPSLIRRCVVTAAFGSAAMVAGLACGAIGDRVIAAPSLRVAAEDYALPFAASATVCAVMVASAAAAATDGLRD